ncbi:MAG: cofactor-independent phosphoglycerate mutase [Candidatus Margulisiibacteriota bacterium]
MKYLVLIGDGMSDLPLKELKGKTPLEAARTPNMDHLAQHGVCGWVNNVPKGMTPGSDVAAMSIFGYDPKNYYTGRGPLEAASLGVKLNKDEIAFRCNLVSVKDGKMHDFTANHISTKEADKILKLLNSKIGSKEIKFHTGLSYRHLLVMKEGVGDSELGAKGLKTTPPHDITGKKIGKYLPQGKGKEVLLKLMNESEVILHQMKTKATLIWPWGQGKLLPMKKLKEKYGLKGAVITAVHLLKGIGKILGMKVINVPGATGYLDTNYKGKAEYAIRALKDNDIVFVHVEAPDEAGHEGDVKKKIRAIEDFDRLVVGTILSWVKGSKACLPVRQGQRVKVLVLPDHPTPISLKTHTSDAVPFVIWGREEISEDKKGREGIKGYNEKEIGKAKLRVKNGYELLSYLLSA